MHTGFIRGYVACLSTLHMLAADLVPDKATFLCILAASFSQNHFIEGSKDWKTCCKVVI